MYVSSSVMCPWRPEMGVDQHELELQMFVSCLVGPARAASALNHH